MRLLVTGGCGFIGSAVVRAILMNTPYSVVNIDKLTYAANPEAVDAVAQDVRAFDRYRHIKADIADSGAMREIIRETAPAAIIHLAAETHVDRSIDAPAAFVTTNIVGTFTLLREAEGYWSRLPAAERATFRFVNVSTDEVFGSLGAEGRFHNDSPYRPNSPYAASKASADHLARVWYRTYGLPVVVTNSSNNYGPFQFPEKLIPLVIAKALAEQKIPVYGKGDNVRDWLHVEDHADALLLIARKGHPGANYNIGDNNEMTNLEVVHAICSIMDDLRPRSGGTPHCDLIEFVQDRPGHDFRYALEASPTLRDIGWNPRHSFVLGLRETVQWYFDHADWLGQVRGNIYDGGRLGLNRTAKP